ncbi:uncharacterized protein [Diadema setosum]|uniref:uncharacterized protein n=1 Tax=Diadema setosum TaxID=31175 RepID=UPI003B3B7F0A
MAQGVMRGGGDGARGGLTFENYYAQGTGHHLPVQYHYGCANTNSSNSNGLDTNALAADVDLSRVQRCECCPYGYHIDLDFVNFCDDIASGANLKKIKKSKRSRPRHSSVKSIRPPPPIIPPRSSSLPSKRNRKPKEKLEPEKILAKENAAFWKIYQQFAKLLRKEYTSEDLTLPSLKASFDNLDTQSLPPEPHDVSLSDCETESIVSLPQGYPAEMERRSSLPSYQVLQQALNTKMDIYNSNIHSGPLALSNLVTLSRQSGSTSSLSSTGSSSAFSPIPHNGSVFCEMDGLKRPLSSTSSLGELSTASGRSTPSSISTNALSAVREQMAAALLRLKQLEEQVKAIPVLQVKISVLKEEKRLLMLQLKAKTKEKLLRHVGVCDGVVEIDGTTTINGDAPSTYYEPSDMVPTSVRSPKPTRPFSPGGSGRVPSPKFGFHGNRTGIPSPISPASVRQSTSSPAPTSPPLLSPTYKPTASPSNRLSSPPLSPSSPQLKSPGPSTFPKPYSGKSAPTPFSPKKAYVSPVPRPNKETRSVGVDANMIAPVKSPEMKSIGINVDMASEEEKPSTVKVIAWKNKIQPMKVSSVHLRTVRSMASWENSRNQENGGDIGKGGSGSSAARESQGKALIREGPITAIRSNETASSPTSSADSLRIHPVTASKIPVPQSHFTFNASQQDCSASPPQSSPNGDIKAPRFGFQSLGLNFCERGINTDIVQTRIMGTNTKPPVPAKRVDASISTDFKKATCDIAVMVRLQPTNTQSTETEVVERVEFGVGTDIQSQDSCVNTITISKEEKGTEAGLPFEDVRHAGIDASVGTKEDGKRAVSCQDSSTSTEAVVAEEKNINTDSVKLVSSGINTERLLECVDSCVGDDIDLNDIICCRKVDMHTIGTNTSQIPTSRSRTIGVGSCSVTDSYCNKCENIQLKSVGTGGDRLSDWNNWTRTIGTNCSVVSRTIGVGADMVCDPKSLLGSVTVAVGDRDVNDVMCNICDKKPQRTIGTGIRVPMRDVSIGDGPIASQNTLGVGQCTVMDRICDRCDNLTTVSVGIGSSDVNRYTHSRSVQVEEGRADSVLFSPLCTSPTGLGFPPLDRQESEENDSVFLTEVDAREEADTGPDFSIISAEAELFNISPVLASQVFAEPPLVDEVTEDVTPEQSHDVSERPSQVDASTRLTMPQGSGSQSFEMAPLRQAENGTTQSPRTVSTGSLDYEIHITMEEKSLLGNGFSNPHAVLAGESPGAEGPRTTLAATMMKRGSQDSGTEGHLSETNDADLQMIPSSALGSSSSSSDSSETDSDSSNSSSSSEDLPSFHLSSAPDNRSTDQGQTEDGENHIENLTPGEEEDAVEKAKEVVEKEEEEEEDEEEEEEEEETYRMSEELEQACLMLGKLIEKQGDSNTKDLASCMATVAKDWFRITSQKASDPRQVRGFLKAVSQDLGKAVLDRIVNLADSSGNTALHYSVSHGNFDIVLLLLSTGVCQANRPNRAGYTTIMLASLVPIQNEKHASVVTRLFREGDVNLRASQAGQTALMLAVSKGRLDMVKLLLTEGSDVNTQDEDGSTALMCASEHGHLDIVKVLLSHPQCDPHLEDNDGSTAFSIAMEAGHKDIGVLLYAHMNFGKQAGSSKKKSSGPSSPQRHMSASASNSPRSHSLVPSQGPSRSTSTSSVSSLPASQSSLPRPDSFSLSGARGRSMLNLSTVANAASTSGDGSSTSRSQSTSPTSEDLPPSQLVRSRSLSPSSRIPSFRPLALPRGSQPSGGRTTTTPSGGSPKRSAAILAAQRLAASHSGHRMCRSSSSGSESPAVQRKGSPTKKTPSGQPKTSSSSGSSSTKSSPRQTPLQKKGVKPSSKYSTV